MKNYKFIVRDEADLEISDAYFWYESKAQGLGERYLTFLDDCFKTIRTNPNSFQKVYKEKRMAVVLTFPFVVLYHITDDQIIISSVFHTSKNPKKWKKRK